jgi:hypothetical protein
MLAARQDAAGSVRGGDRGLPRDIAAFTGRQANSRN